MSWQVEDAPVADADLDVQPRSAVSSTAQVVSPVTKPDPWRLATPCATAKRPIRLCLATRSQSGDLYGEPRPSRCAGCAAAGSQHRWSNGSVRSWGSLRRVPIHTSTAALLFSSPLPAGLRLGSADAMSYSEFRLWQGTYTAWAKRRSRLPVIPKVEQSVHDRVGDVGELAVAAARVGAKQLEHWTSIGGELTAARRVPANPRTRLHARTAARPPRSQDLVWEPLGRLLVFLPSATRASRGRTASVLEPGITGASRPRHLAPLDGVSRRRRSVWLSEIAHGCVCRSEESRLQIG